MELTEEQYQEQLESDRALSLNEADKEEGRKENPANDSQKMGVMFFSILFLLCVIADFIDMITVGTIGWLVGLLVDAVLLLSAGISKGGRKQFKKILLGVIGETIPIPFLAILPFRSLFLVWSFVNSRYELPIQLGLSEHKQTELGE